MSTLNPSCHPPLMQTQPLISDARIPSVVEDYLSLVQSCHISPLGLVPKSQPGKWRLITDLSSPRYHSINDGITPDLCSIQYCKVDDAIQLLLTYGANALMCKVDLKSAYRVIPIHPDDRPLLSIRCISQHGLLRYGRYPKSFLLSLMPWHG